MLKNFAFENSKLACTPMTTRFNLIKEDKSPKIDASQYRSIIRGLLYLTTTRSNIMYAVCLVAKQEPKESHVWCGKEDF